MQVRVHAQTYNLLDSINDPQLPHSLGLQASRHNQCVMISAANCGISNAEEVALIGKLGSAPLIPLSSGITPTWRSRDMHGSASSSKISHSNIDRESQTLIQIHQIQMMSHLMDSMNFCDGSLNRRSNIDPIDQHSPRCRHQLLQRRSALLPSTNWLSSGGQIFWLDSLCHRTLACFLSRTTH